MANFTGCAATGGQQGGRERADEIEGMQASHPSSRGLRGKVWRQCGPQVLGNRVSGSGGLPHLHRPGSFLTALAAPFWVVTEDWLFKSHSSSPSCIVEMLSVKGESMGIRIEQPVSERPEGLTRVFALPPFRTPRRVGEAFPAARRRVGLSGRNSSSSVEMSESRGELRAQHCRQPPTLAT